MNLKERLRLLVPRVLAPRFSPSALSYVTNPFDVARGSLYEGISRHSGALHGRVLDIGCGTAPYSREFFPGRWTGLEIDSDANRARGVATLFYDGTYFPVESSTFGGILCTQVLEHVFEPEIFLGEVFRVLEPGGRVLITVPFLWEEHEAPADYGRYSSFGLRHLLESSGFTIVTQEKLTTGTRGLGQLAIANFASSLDHSKPASVFAAQILFMFPMKLFFELFAKFFPGNENLFLDNLIVCEKPRAEK